MRIAKALLLGERIEHRVPGERIEHRVPGDQIEHHVPGAGIEHRALAADGTPAAEPLTLPAPQGSAAFAFRWGAVVLMDFTPEAEAALLASLAPRIHAPFARPAEEIARIETDAEADGIDSDGTIRLRDAAPARLALVADTLAKSAALGQQEALLAEALDQLESSIAALRAEGRIAATSRDLLRQVGQALLARSRTVARVEAEDRPDILWDNPALVRLHARLADEYELRERSRALDRKLALIGDTSSALLAMVQARRSYWLEAAVVALVATDLVLSLYEFVLR